MLLAVYTTPTVYSLMRMELELREHIYKQIFSQEASLHADNS